MRRFFQLMIFFSGPLSFASAQPLVLPLPRHMDYVPRHYVYPKVDSDSVAGHHELRQQEASPHSNYHRSHLPTLPTAIPSIPMPYTVPLQPKTLSLKEAIALALRDNVTVKSSELQRVKDKFTLEIAKQAYRLKWADFTFTSTLQNHTLPTWSMGTGISVDVPSGTDVSITHTNNLLGGAGVNKLTVKQALLKGFGTDVNSVNYKDAVDADKVARLTFKSSIQGVVNTVITDYRSLVENINTLQTNKQTLKAQEKTVWRAKQRVKAGKDSRSNLLQQEASLESDKLTVVQGIDTWRNAYRSFLTTLGLIPTAKLKIDRKISISQYKIPSLKQCIALGLKGNIPYRTALINLRVTKRALITAEDARKWTLDATGSVTQGSERSDLNSAITSEDINPTLAISLTIPIDDISAKSGVVSAKINIQNAISSLRQLKQTTISNIMNEWDSVHNQLQQVKISEQNVSLDEKNYRDAQLRLKYGKTTVFEANSFKTTMINAQLALISTKITYLNDITALYKTLGLLLHNYHIKLRY